MPMELHEFETRYLQALNARQREAVLAAEGPVLLLATPGSGKTTVLILRLGYLILCRGVSPESILTMTYTRSATRDMRDRFAAYFGEALARRMQFRTINGVSSRIIAAVAARCGREPFPVLGDEGERSRILRTLYQDLTDEYPEDSTVRDLSTAITYIKNMLLTDDEIAARSWSMEQLPELYVRYQAELRRLRVMDYDDQMVYALRLLRRFPDVLDELQEQYRYLCVDEAQDTSRVQHEIIRALSAKYDNLFMVGDEDQSIYGFRAAFPEALMRFEAEHPGARTLLIEENYRSTPEIVRTANRFVARNRFRHPKAMTAVRGSGPAVELIPVKHRGEQYDRLLDLAASMDEDTAILYRNNDSALPLIDSLQQAGLPFRCRNYEDSFFTHRIVTDILDTIRFAAAPEDPELFLRIYYKFGAGITKSDAREAVRRAGGRGNLFQALLALPDLKPATREAIPRLLYALGRLPSDSAEGAIRRIWEDMHYGRYVEHRHLDAGKYFILSMLARDVPSGSAFLEKLNALRDTVMTAAAGDRGPVLSTIHSSKGLEYGTVYLLDALDGILPSIPAARAGTEEEIRTYEEERRLFYVAMTRAKDRLHIFLTETGASFPAEVARSLPLTSTATRAVLKFLHLPLPDGKPTLSHGGKARDEVRTFPLRPGLRVVHQRFGAGTVREMTGDIAVIAFDREGVRKLSLSVSFRQGLLKPEKDS